MVDNKAAFELHFPVLLEQGWYTPVAHAQPHQSEMILSPSMLPASQCTTGGMTAYADDGREVARHDRPLCVGDRWVIDLTSPAGSTSSTGSG